MKIVLFILFNLIITYNTYATSCSEIIRTNRLKGMIFHLSNPREEVIAEDSKEVVLVEYYSFDNTSHFNLDGKFYYINSCATNIDGTVVFYKYATKKLMLYKDGSFTLYHNYNSTYHYVNSK